MQETQQDIRREWHTQPVTVVVHILTLIAVIAGFGLAAGVMQERQEQGSKIQDSLQNQMLETFRKDASQDGKIAVLESQYGEINKKLDTIVTEIRELHQEAQK